MEQVKEIDRLLFRPRGYHLHWHDDGVYEVFSNDRDADPEVMVPFQNLLNAIIYLLKKGA